ncbi:MAG: DUF4232 domain-containing protein [Solirubrobacteraceae bacterium]
MRRPSLHRATTRIAAALAVAVVLAACAGTGVSTSTRNPARTQAAAGTQSVSTTTITSTVSSSASTSSAASGSGGPPACRAAGLALRFLGQQGATGHGELGFGVRNTGSASCRTFGYPGVQFLDTSGGRLPTRSQRVTDDFFGHVGVVEIVLAPGASASFRLAVTHGNASPAGCTTARGLQVYPPDDTATLHITIPEGAAECGTATVSPIRPGTSAYQ